MAVVFRWRFKTLQLYWSLQSDLKTGAYAAAGVSRAGFQRFIAPFTLTGSIKRRNHFKNIPEIIFIFTPRSCQDDLKGKLRVAHDTNLT